MKHLCRPAAALAAAVLLLGILAPPGLAAEAEPSELEALMEQFRADYGLNEENFSLCYYNTATGETYRYNDETFFFAASTYKLPLNLYYYELENAGQIASDASIGGVSLADCHYQSLVWSNNDVSIDMLYNLGDFRTYKTCMQTYFTMDEADIPYIYYVDNYYCTSMMLDTLQYLYENREQFPEMLDYMGQAQPGQYFDRYLSDQWDVAHKYGYFVDDETGVTNIHDTGIVYTDDPFLLAVYTANAPRGEEVLARAAETLAAYTTEQFQRRQAELEAQREAEEQAELEAQREAEEQAALEAQREAEEQAALEAQREAEEQAELEAQREAEEQAELEARQEAEARREQRFWLLGIGGAAVLLILVAVLLIRTLRKGKR